MTPCTQDFVSDIIDPFVGAIFIVSGATSDGAPVEHGRLSIGFVSNDPGGLGLPEQLCIAGRARHAPLTQSDAITSASLTSVIVVPHDSTGTVSSASARARATEVLTNGVRLEWTQAQHPYLVTCILFGGRGDSFISFIQMSTSSSGTSNNLTGGFLADLFVLLAFEGMFADPANSDFDMSLGFAARSGSTVQQACISHFFQDNADPTVSKALVLPDRATATLTGTSDYSTGEITAFTDTGFEITGVRIGGGVPSPTVAVLGLEFFDALDCRVASHPLPSGAGETALGGPSSGLMTRPQLVLAFSDLIAAAGTPVSDATAGALGVSAFSRARSYSHCVSHDEGLSLPNVMPFASTSSKSYTDSTALALLEETGSLDQEADLVRMTSNGFRLDFTNATTPGRVIVLGIEAYPPVR